MNGSLRGRLAAGGLSGGEAERKSHLFKKALRALDRLSEGKTGTVGLWYVPGRIEVLGKHTDYAGGPSLLGAVERAFCLAASPRRDEEVRIADAVRGLEIRFPLGEEPVPASGDWSTYPRTVARRVARNFPGPLRGVDLAFASDLPPSAGISSSSALVVAVFSALCEAGRLDQHPRYRAAIGDSWDLAGYLGCVENGGSFGALAGEPGVGTFGGSEDHTAILCCRPRVLSLCRYSPVREDKEVLLPPETCFVIGVSGVEAQKAGAARERYNRASLAAGTVLRAWREAGGGEEATLLEAVTSAPDAPGRIREALIRSAPGPFPLRLLLDRFEHFLQETQQVIPAAVGALERGDLAALGEAVDHSQQAAERLLGNQVPETIALARSARALGAPAASAFGGGYGGSVWALVPSHDAESFRAAWREDYERLFPDIRGQEFFVTGAGPGRIRL